MQNPGANRDGLAGEGVGGGAIGGGNGDRFPAALPTDITVQSDGIQNTLGDTGFNVFGDPLLPTDGDRCILQMVAGPGAGGAYALDGGKARPSPSASPSRRTPPAFRSSLRPPLAARTLASVWPRRARTTAATPPSCAGRTATFRAARRRRWG